MAAGSGQPVVLTRRGQAVARISSLGDEDTPPRYALGPLRGSVEMHGSFDDLVADLDQLRRERGATLDSRIDVLGGRLAGSAASSPARRKRRG